MKVFICAIVIYVCKIFRFSHAAKAFEECDRKYRPVFAEPRKSQQERMAQETFVKGTSNTTLNLLDLPEEGYTRLIVIGSPFINQDQFWRLCDLIPGLDYCQVNYEGRPRPTRAVAEVVYTSSQAAAYAKEKLHGFEYPIGHRLIVRPDHSSRANLDVRSSGFDSKQTFDSRNLIDRPGFSNSSKIMDKTKPDILQIAETIAHASSIIQAAALSPGKI